MNFARFLAVFFIFAAASAVAQIRPIPVTSAQVIIGSGATLGHVR